MSATHPITPLVVSNLYWTIEALNHNLGLRKSEQCDILAIFKKAEQDSGGHGTHIDLMLQSSHKNLASEWIDVKHIYKFTKFY